MPFVNEFVSEEDVKKFGLDELMREYDPFWWRQGRPVGFRHTWTIDRSRGVYLIRAKIVEEAGPSGRPEPTHKHIFILDHQGKRARAILDRSGTSSKFGDTPFRVKLAVLSLDVTKARNLTEDEVIQVLKEALTVYGHSGALSPVKNVAVEFAF